MAEHPHITPSANGAQDPSAGGYSAADVDRLTGATTRLTYDDLDPAVALDLILQSPDPILWSDPENMRVLASFYGDKVVWLKIKTRYQDLKGPLWDLENAAKDLWQRAHGTADSADGMPLVTDMDTVTSRPIDWLWYPYSAIGKICLLDGDPGVGKTLFATQFAANVTLGHPMPDQEGKMTLSCGSPGVVVFVATEDDLEDTVKPRLERSGADCSKVKVFNEWQDGAGKIHAFTLADLPYLETVLKAYRPRLVYIDAIQAVLGGKVDANSANQLKQLLDPLAKLARTYQCAILAARHPAKPGQNNVKLIHRGANSMAIIGTARLGLFAEDHPCDPTKVLLLQSKSNAGAIGRTQIFTKAEGKFEWAGISRIRKEDLAGATHGPDSRAWLSAYFWLEQRLKDGLAEAASTLEREANDEQDLTPGMLKRAKKALGVVSTKSTEPDGGWTWRLPPLPVSTPPSSPSSSSSPTSPTSTSLDKSIGYGEEVEGDGVREEDEEIEEVEVDEFHSHTEADCYPPPRGTEPAWICVFCQGTAFWTNTADQPVCQRCHPRPTERKDV